MDPIEIRRATEADAGAAFVVLEGVAHEIPVLLEGDTRRDLVIAQVRSCCQSEISWVAVDRGEVIGFLLVEVDRVERFLHDNDALHLPYGDVARPQRGRHVLSRLMQAVMAQRAPLTAEVKRQNSSDMVQRLTRLGFDVTSQADGQTNLRWTPGQTLSPEAR